MTDLFSVKMIFRTLFDPWKRDQVSYKNLSIQERFNVMILNLVSRMVGFLVKIIVFAIYLVFSAGLISLSFLASAIWLSLPLLAMGLILLGVFEIIINR